MQPGNPPLLHAFQLAQAGRKAEAVLLINQLANQGDTGALYTLAEMKWRGGLVPQDMRQGRDLYRRAGEAGHRLAAAYYTNLLSSGIAGDRDWTAALKRLREEARQDSARRRAAELGQEMRLTRSEERRVGKECRS